MSIKPLLISYVTAALLYLGYQAYNWRSPDVHLNATIGLHDCIYNDASHQKYILKTVNNAAFNATLVANSSPDCINPYFPTIHIETAAPHNAWVHIVHTDSKYANLKTFIDAPDQNNQHSSYPFYSLEKGFYDAPLWRYTLFSKPISFWRGHAYAVNVDHDHKIITCLGGIAWGFRLPYFNLYPEAIKPSILLKNDWKNDWQVLKTKLNGYQSTW